MTTTDKNFKVKNGIVVGGSGVFSGTVEVATPTADDHAATKAYVDQNAGGATVSDNPPENPSVGDQWYNSLDGVTYIYYDSYWVESSSGGQETNLDGYATEQYVDDAIAAIPAPDFTGYATETYVNTAVSNLVDSAPTTLDTLNELAAALGDDPNFATTVTTALGNKQDKVSGVSDTEIGYLDGVTSAIQTQLNAKANAIDPAFTVNSSSSYVPPSGISGNPYDPSGVPIGARITLNSVFSNPGYSIGEIIYLTGTTASGYNIDNVLVQIADQSSGMGWQLFVTAVNSSDTANLVAWASTFPYIGSGVTIYKPVQLSVSAAEISYLDGVTSAIQTQLDGKAPAAQPVSDKSANYTLQASDANSLVRSTNSAITITVPDVLANGQRIDFIQAGAGQITFAGSGVTINSADAKLKTAKQYAAATVLKAGGSYYLIGNLG